MDFIQRQLQQTIEDRLFQGKAIILIGARQVGKSTLFHQIIANKEQVLTLNCDDPEARNLLENANLSELRQLLADNRIVLVDEAQRLTKAGLTLKLITDQFPNVQLLVTGSSSFLLQGALNEPLTGRKYEYRLFPFSTQEIYPRQNSPKSRLKSPLQFSHKKPFPVCRRDWCTVRSDKPNTSYSA